MAAGRGEGSGVGLGGGEAEAAPARPPLGLASLRQSTPQRQMGGLLLSALLGR